MTIAVLLVAALAFSVCGAMPSPSIITTNTIPEGATCASSGGYCADACHNLKASRQKSCELGQVCCIKPDVTTVDPFAATTVDPFAEVDTSAEAPDYNAQCQMKLHDNPMDIPDPDWNCCGRAVNYTDDSQDRIYNGNVSRRGQFPWLARLFTADNRSVRCSGFLISARHVVTALHCLESPRIYDQVQQIGFGCESGGIRRCQKIIGMEDYERREFHFDDFDRREGMTDRPDIAVIRLSEPAPFTNTIRPICLPRQEQPSEETAPLQYFVAGWGKTEHNNKTGKKLFTRVPHLSKNECKKALEELCKNKTYQDSAACNNASEAIKSYICAGGLKGDTCYGDSGGPLMKLSGKRYEAVGVILKKTTRNKDNTDINCGQEKVPGLYLEVRRHIQWIQDMMNEVND